MPRQADLGALRRLRRAREAELGVLPNVIGTGLGVKRRAGDQVANGALVIFVRQKVPEGDLAPPERVPKYLDLGAIRVPTDVIAVAGIREEFGSAPYFISDRVKRGTVTAFASSDRVLHAVSCAHCLRGRDGNPHTVEPIEFWDPGDGRYVPGGESVFAVSAPGYGIPGSFGFSDAGLVELHHRDLIARARRALPLQIATRLRKGVRLVGQTPTSTIEGVIDVVEVTVERRRVDIVVYMPGRGTVPGNSGMLWRTLDGAAAAVHSMGLYNDESAESRYSLTMSAGRMAAELRVELLDPGWRT